MCTSIVAEDNKGASTPTTGSLTTCDSSSFIWTEVLLFVFIYRVGVFCFQVIWFTPEIWILGCSWGKTHLPAFVHVVPLLRSDSSLKELCTVNHPLDSERLQRATHLALCLWPPALMIKTDALLNFLLFGTGPKWSNPAVVSEGGLSQAGWGLLLTCKRYRCPLWHHKSSMSEHTLSQKMGKQEEMNHGHSS